MSGYASLAGAAFLIRDGQMRGDRIAVLERLKLPGGALDGIKEPRRGCVVRGGRELEDHIPHHPRGAGGQAHRRGLRPDFLTPRPG